MPGDGPDCGLDRSVLHAWEHKIGSFVEFGSVFRNMSGS